MILPLGKLQAQEKYRISPYPDVWYNSVDGVRLGLRLLGEMEGSFKDGPHRLDVGIWASSKIPELPISYYLSFTEPISAISSYAQEGNLQAISSVRTGFARHRLQFNKRWVNGFNENEYTSLSAYISQEKLFDSQYQLYSELWNKDWKSLLGVQLTRKEEISEAILFGLVKLEHNLAENSGRYTQIRGHFVQKFPINSVFNVRIREFAGVNIGEKRPENSFFFSVPPFTEQLEHGYSRARGTIPPKGLENGVVQFTSPTTIRGYSHFEYKALQAASVNPSLGLYSFYDKIFGFNLEVEFLNPLQKRLQQSIVNNIFEVRSYLFLDGAKGVGTYLLSGQNLEEESNTEVADFRNTNDIVFSSGAGLQISFNIPDYLANDRGFFLRYEVPFWLSSPEEGESKFKYRNLIGIGAIFSF